MSSRRSHLLAPIFLLVLGSTFGLGCAAPVTEEQPSASDGASGAATEADGPLGLTTQAFSWGSFATWKRSDNLPTASNRADIGSDANMTCFLAGVGGNLESAQGAPQPQGSLYTSSSAGVYRSNGRWFIEARPGIYGNRVHASALCVNSVAGRSAVFGWTSGSPAKQMLPVTAQRRCFLTRVFNTDPYYSDNNFNSSGDELRVWNDGSYWYIGGSGDASGHAMCIDVTNDFGEWHWIGSTTQNLAYNDKSPGTQCFLTGIRGAFRTNSWDSGVFIKYDAGLNQYKMVVTGGKHGWSRCIE